MILPRKRHIISINVQDADRRSEFPEEKARLPSYVPKCNTEFIKEVKKGSRLATFFMF